MLRMRENRTCKMKTGNRLLWSWRSLPYVMLLAALVATFGVAHAAQICNPTIQFAGRAVQSCKDNYDSGSYWKGRMVSKVTSGGSVAKLGWNYWSDTRWCSGVAVAQYVYNSSYGYNSTNWASTSADHPRGTCGGANEAQVYGIHYWEQSGQTKTDTWSYWRTLH